MVLVLCFVVGVTLGVVIFKLENRTSKQEIAGTETQDDPNHPVEIYYGSPEFQNLDSMVSDLAITVYPEDKTEAIPVPEMGLGSKITITRATPVKVTDAKKPFTYRTWVNTVGDLLKEKNIELLGQDSASPALTTSISYNMTVTITRVAEVEVVEKEPIDYKVVKQYDNTLEKGNNHVDQKGINGEKVVTYKVKRIDGEEVSRSIVNSEVTKQPQNEILVIGTKVIVYGTGKATWYSRNATMVAASNTIPKGTMVKVVAVSSGKSVVVEIDDAGIQSDAIIDLSDDAFAALAPLGAGVIKVRVEKYYPF